MKHRIEKATIEHLELVEQLWLRLMEEHKKMDPVFFAEVEKNKEDYCNNLTLYINSPENVLFLLIVEGMVVGYITAEIERAEIARYRYYNSEKCCIVEDIMIDENVRGNGMGKLLIEEVKKWSNQFNVDCIELNVLSKNKSAYDFFKKIGFQDNFHTMCLKLGNV